MAYSRWWKGFSVRARLLVILGAFLLVAGVATYMDHGGGKPPSPDDRQKEGPLPGKSDVNRATDELSQALQSLFERRAEAVVKGDIGLLNSIYSTDASSAIKHEKRRVRYVKAWAKKRGVRLTGRKVFLEIQYAETRGNLAFVNVWSSMNISYIHTNPSTSATPSGSITRAGRTSGHDQVSPLVFGIRTRHKMVLVCDDKGWRIRKDDYTDPLGEDTLVPEVAPAAARPDVSLLALQPAVSHRQKGLGYDRDAAVAYANRYCGVKLSRDGSFGYNLRYKDYTDLGGDCTNFISQVLGDREAGKLPMNDTWNYNYSAGEAAGGSKAWTQTEAFAEHLFSSGIAKCIARGDYYSVTGSTRQFPRGAINELRKGDLIAYEEKGDIQHFAVVVGRNPAGYVLVNTHTADRYKVPWDLGWDRKTVFWLIKVL